VTYTGTGASQTVSHLLNGTVGALIIKKTSGTGNWATFTRTGGAAGSTLYAYFNSAAGLNLTAAANATGAAAEAAGIITTTSFNPNDLSGSGAPGDVNNINDSGATYVAYLFAHNAGGFGTAGTDNVISCGSFSASPGAFVNLGYEPQWVLVKCSSGADNWNLFDNMRGLTMTDDSVLNPNLSNAENNSPGNDYLNPQPTGFTQIGFSGTNIYIAIRRGPMKVPTSATTVFTPLALNNASGTVNTTGFPIDLQMQFYRSGGIGASNSQWVDRLRGFSSNSTQTGPRLYTPSDSAENVTALGTFFSNTGFSTSGNWASIPMVYWNWRRAPGFFDEVCYTGTGSARTITHNLTVAPQLLFVKSRSNVQNWSALCTLNSGLQGNLNTTGTLGTPSAAVWGSGGVYVAPTASVFTVGTDNETNASGWTYVAYLFATCAGVSKVGSYTGNATLTTIDCGFTGGARWVLIKRTNSALSWYVWDTARGMVSGTDPSVQLNFTSGDVSGNSVFTVSTGFQIVASPFVDINAIGDTYIFLAIA
jgi:hypothetical protein